MSTPKFTPGPWAARFVETMGFWSVCSTIPTSPGMDGVMVAEVNNSVRHRLDKPASDEANARLIAAAPELFDALVRLVGAVAGDDRDRPGGGGPDPAPAFARAAIAKATGPPGPVTPPGPAGATARPGRPG